ncbi:hypothetical protein FPV16_24335 [Methylobacterium sp. W2]|uniref:hypothetical protein n=1 Tax=Methylobacterium sp. W2 TaxID=2598107 RepID=UPI001D0C4A5A|nr:hypothetical protein [Methylobacterium sp. W2]MCC0809287.1 hypothetical protein [Methylobacterium sp. W2]
MDQIRAELIEILTCKIDALEHLAYVMAGIAADLRLHGGRPEADAVTSIVRAHRIEALRVRGELAACMFDPMNDVDGMA